MLITIDALRADHVGCLGHHRQVSPHIDRLATEGVLFSQAIANGPRSPASFPSILASTYQSAGAEHRLPQSATTLAEVLKRHGYATAGFCGGNVYISTHYGYDRGFDQFQDFLVLDSGAKRAPRESKGRLVPLKKHLHQALEDSGRYDPAFVLFSSALQGKKNIADMAKGEDAHPFESGETLNEEALAWLSGQSNRPFFLWIHYMDVHFPYLPRVPRHRLSDYARFALSLICLLLKRHAYPRKVLVDLYDDRIREADERLARFLAQLRDRGLYEDTVIVLTADHGEEFWDHGGWVHGPKLYEELLRVPLIMAGPGLPGGTRVTEQVGLIDLAPTILDLLGIEEKVETFQGASLLPWLTAGRGEPPRPYVFSEEVHLGGRRPVLWDLAEEGSGLYRLCSCRNEDWKYIWDEEGGKEELYHLHHDPGEKENLADSELETVRRFESAVKHHLSRFDSSAMAAEHVNEPRLSPEEEEELLRRLRDLGYF